jgi:hypothetical protein
MDETKPPEKKKGPIGRLKELADDKEEQLQIIGVFVRLGVVIWSGFIVSLNYISIPGYSSEPKDITFPASLLTGALASFGLEGAKKRGDGTFEGDPDDKPMSKKEMVAMMNERGGAYQTIRVETPIKIIGAEVVRTDPLTGKDIDPTTGRLS